MDVWKEEVMDAEGKVGEKDKEERQVEPWWWWSNLELVSE